MQSVTQKAKVIHPEWEDEIIVLYDKIARLSDNEIADIIGIDRENRRYKLRWHKKNVVEELFFNKASGNYWCCPSPDLKPKERIRGYKETVSNVIFCKTKKFLNFSAAQNCDEPILKCAMNLDQNLNLGVNDSPKFYAQGERTHFNSVSYSDYESRKQEFENYTKFIVYMDPFERFMNLADYIYASCDKFIGAPFLNLEAKKSDFIDELILLAQIYNENEDIFCADPNFITQSKAFSLAEFESLDYVVLSQNIRQFAQNVLKIENPQTFLPPSFKVIGISDFSYEQAEKIKEIYKEDYELFEKIKEKLYLPRKNDEDEEYDKIDEKETNDCANNFSEPLIVRLAYSCVTPLVVFLFTKSIKIALLAGLIDFVIKFVLSKFCDCNTQNTV